ncbi:hypothetical protein COOONC_26181 [Cooperia oncophora]
MTSNGKIVVNGIYSSCHNIVQSYSLQNTFFSYADSLEKTLCFTLLNANGYC